jgi:hypothetical protein
MRICTIRRCISANKNVPSAILASHLKSNKAASLVLSLHLQRRDNGDGVALHDAHITHTASAFIRERILDEDESM